MYKILCVACKSPEHLKVTLTCPELIAVTPTPHPPPPPNSRKYSALRIYLNTHTSVLLCSQSSRRSSCRQSGSTTRRGRSWGARPDILAIGVGEAGVVAEGEAATELMPQKTHPSLIQYQSLCLILLAYCFFYPETFLCRRLTLTGRVCPACGWSGPYV